MSDASNSGKFGLPNLEDVLPDVFDRAHIDAYNTHTHSGQALFYAQTYLGYPHFLVNSGGMDIPGKLRAIMRETDKNQGELAEAFGVSQPTVHRWLKGAEPEGHRRDQINEMYERVFGEAPRGGRPVRLMGLVGAGAEIMPDMEQVPPEGLDQIEIDFPIPDGLICFRVQGDSMLPQFRDGAMIVVWSEQKRPLEAFYGQEAVVRTADGRRFIKTIMRGQQGVNLVSWNAAPIENQTLLWIGEIYMILPPRIFARADRNFRAAG